MDLNKRSPFGANTTLNVVIIGGSLSGLMQGMMLKRLGHNVRILEQVSASKREGQASGIGVGPDLGRFYREHDLSHQPFTLDSPGIQRFYGNWDRYVYQMIALKATSWPYLYYRLRGNFDGFKSAFCNVPPEVPSTDGNAVYETSKKVTSVEHSGDSVSVTFEDGITGNNETTKADLVIVANGAISLAQLNLESQERPYAGYCLWRGTVPEMEVSEATKEKFGLDFIHCYLKRNYVVLYMMPGDDGSLSPGNRLINFAWYCNLDGDSEDFSKAMTDVEGHRHRTTLPIGGMSEEVWAKQLAFADKVLPEPFKEVVHKIKKPFITAISDAISPRAVYFGGRLLLTGDALCLIRPHTGMGANQGARHCLSLKEVMEGRMTSNQWQRQVLEYSRGNMLLSRTWGTYYLGSFVAYLVSELKYRATVLSNRLSNLYA